MRILSQLILPRRTYLYWNTENYVQICKINQSSSKRKSNPDSSLLLEPIVEKTIKVNFELHEYCFRETNRNIFSTFEQSQCLTWLPFLLTISRHWPRNPVTFYYLSFLKAVVVIRYICNHLQVFFEKHHSKLHWRIPLLDSLF